MLHVCVCCGAQILQLHTFISNTTIPSTCCVRGLAAVHLLALRFHLSTLHGIAHTRNTCLRGSLLWPGSCLFPETHYKIFEIETRTESGVQTHTHLPLLNILLLCLSFKSIPAVFFLSLYLSSCYLGRRLVPRTFIFREAWGHKRTSTHTLIKAHIFLYKTIPTDRLPIWTAGAASDSCHYL